jgi:hypothetical protein
MKEEIVKNEVRLVQVFLTKDRAAQDSGIYEVSISSDRKILCTCPGWLSLNRCKHSDIVRARLDEDGNYPFEISERATKKEGEIANISNEKFREFIIKYGKIEVV